MTRSALGARQLILDHASAEIFGAFRENGVSSILLKGPSIARWLFRADEVRSYGDVDLLVRQSAIATAREILERCGFRLLSAVIPGDRPRVVEEWQRSRDGVLLDLHVNLEGIGISSDSAWDVLVRDREQIEISGYLVDVLGESARALHLALHAAQHGPTVQQPLIDLERAVSRLTLELWQRSAALAFDLQAAESMSAGLRLVPAGDELADSLDLPGVENRVTKMRAAGVSTPVLFLEHLGTRATYWERLVLLVRKTFPSRRFMRSWVSQGNVRVSTIRMGYLYRPFWLIGMAIKGYREKSSLR